MIIDTSAFIEMIRKGEFIEGSLSVITVIEILRGVKPGKRKKVKKLIEESF
ncbi:MAG: type II toxin-antitoxin system VapC family toxin, partial [Thermoprotei archaeon]